MRTYLNTCVDKQLRKFTMLMQGQRTYFIPIQKSYTSATTTNNINKRKLNNSYYNKIKAHEFYRFTIILYLKFLMYFNAITNMLS